MRAALVLRDVPRHNGLIFRSKLNLFAKFYTRKISSGMQNYRERHEKGNMIGENQRNVRQTAFVSYRKFLFFTKKFMLVFLNCDLITSILCTC